MKNPFSFYSAQKNKSVKEFTSTTTWSEEQLLWDYPEENKEKLNTKIQDSQLIEFLSQNGFPAKWFRAKSFILFFSPDIELWSRNNDYALTLSAPRGVMNKEEKAEIIWILTQQWC